MHYVNYNDILELRIIIFVAPVHNVRQSWRGLTNKVLILREEAPVQFLEANNREDCHQYFSEFVPK